MPTKLEAINESLLAVGQAPLNVASTGRDYQIIELMLDANSRREQSRGFHFNTEHNVPLTRDMDNKIPVADNVLELDVPAREADVVVRGGFLYDLANRTFVFTRDLTATVITKLDWDDLPVTFRDYLALRTALLFLERFMPDELVDGTLRDEVAKAQSTLARSELSRADANFFNDPISQRIAYR